MVDLVERVGVVDHQLDPGDAFAQALYLGLPCLDTTAQDRVLPPESLQLGLAGLRDRLFILFNKHYIFSNHGEESLSELP